MGDAFLLGAGFSKAVSQHMPTMKELFELLKGLIGAADGFNQEAYDYAAGNVETLLSYYAIPGPSDDPIEVLRKRRVTALLELSIGEVLQARERAGVEDGLNPNVGKLVAKWDEQRSHVLTANYDTLVEGMAVNGMSDAQVSALYPINVIPAVALSGHNPFGTVHWDTFTLYKLHGSVSWYASADGSNADPIYGSCNARTGVPYYQKMLGDKRRFIAPPVHDKSTLLNHAGMRNLWRQAEQNALHPADRLYVIGYSLPETDMAMRTLLWESRRPKNQGEQFRKIPLYLVDVSRDLGRHYKKMLGNYYAVIDTYTGGERPFDRFVEDYTKDGPQDHGIT